MGTPSPRTVIIIAVAILSIAAYSAIVISGTVTLGNVPSHFTVNSRTFAITGIASDEHSREVGLMHQDITNSTAELFVFPSPGTYAFWMSGVNSSLDVIWLSMDGEVGHVVYIARNVPPCPSSPLCPDYSPPSPASWVLEVQGGFSSLNGINVGSQFTFS
jgi:uncharacterized membrane protein (UPF0127 family)